MKKYLNILVNRNAFKSKFILVIVSMLLFISVGKSENKSSETKSGIVINGLVRDAHTKLPINAAQITGSDKKTAVVTDASGHFTLKINSANEILYISAFDYNNQEVTVG